MTHRWHRCCITLDDVRERCRVDAETGCWHWLGSSSNAGTPKMYAIDLDRNTKRTMAATQAVWMIAYGHPLAGRLVHRTCWVRDCLNPAHLRAVKSRSEIGSALARNGKRRGTSIEQRRANQRLAMAAAGITPTAPEIVLAIRAIPRTVTNRAIAREHGIAEQTVSRIRRGLSHRDLLEAA